MPELSLPSYVLSALTRLNASGYSAYAVGGCVRDLLLGRPVHDFDLCTDATPNETLAVFADCHIVPTGLKHGTVTVLIEGEPLEITTFRLEGAYSDGRHPDSVSFSASIEEDLSRRDFTINAMAYHPKTGLTDPFGGQADLAARHIRCVGDPQKRFSEDALRILRAFRFASVLGFSVEKHTLAAAYALKGHLERISRERVREELYKLLVGIDAYPVLKNHQEILTQILPELQSAIGYHQNNPHHDFTLYEHLIRTACALPSDPLLRLAALLHDVEKPSTMSLDAHGISHYYSHAARSAETVKSILTRLRCSNCEIERAVKLVRYHDGVIEPTEKAVKHRLNQLGPDGFQDLLSLQLADRISQKRDIAPVIYERNQALRTIAASLLAQGACFDLSSLAVNGHDLIALGYHGKDIGKALSLLLDAVLNGECENERRALLEYLSLMPLKNNPGKGADT